MNTPQRDNDIQMNAAGMYREDVFTDNTVGSLRQLTPVTADGTDDGSRATLFVGSTQVLTNAGPLPLSFEIQANSLKDAIANFGPAAREAFERTLEELRELQREQASSIVVPRGSLDPGKMGGRGGGGIKLP